MSKGYKTYKAACKALEAKGFVKSEHHFPVRWYNDKGWTAITTKNSRNEYEIDIRGAA